jgi:Tol biopolymer transport system component
MPIKKTTHLSLATSVLLALSPTVARPEPHPSDHRRRAFDLASRSDDGEQGDNDSDRAALSAGGRYVAFASLAGNLVPGDTNLFSDVFVRDRRRGTIERVSVGPLGAEGDADSGMLSLLGSADISRDGRFVAFASEASNFVAGDTPLTADVFVHDRATHTTELVSRGVDGRPAGGSTAPSISGDGRFVAFRSFSDRLRPDGNPNFADHVYVADRARGTIERVDVASDGTLAAGGAFHVLISADGRVVAFDSDAGNLVAGDGDQASDVFVHDRRTGRTEGVSTPRPTDTFTGQSFLSSISGDGRFVGFESTDPTLARDDRGFSSDAFVLDRERRRLRLVSRNRDGEPGNDDSFGALVSDDGRFVVFSSRASDLVRRDTNQATDVFRRDLENGRTERLAADDTVPDRPFGFEVLATDITPRAGKVALLTRADLAPEQDVGSFVADVYVLDPRGHRAAGR